MDPLTALLVLTLFGILLRQHAVVQAQRLRAPAYTPPVRSSGPPGPRGNAAACGRTATGAQEASAEVLVGTTTSQASRL